MKLTILGAGTYQPELERHSAAYLIETDKAKICFDFGRGAIDQLLQLGVHVNQIDAIFISHWHSDHISDLLPLLHITIAAPADLVADWIPRKKPLKIYGPDRPLERIEFLMKVSYLDYSKLDNIEVKEISEDVIKGDHWTIKSYLAKHNPETESLCFRLESGDKILAYSGDTTDCEGLRKAIKNVDLAMIEAGWPEKVKPKTHLTGLRAGKIAQEENVKKLVLTHVAPYYLKNGNPVQDAAKYFKGGIVLAQDLLKIDI